MLTNWMLWLIGSGVGMIACGSMFGIIKPAAGMTDTDTQSSKFNVGFTIEKLMCSRAVQPLLNLLSRNKEVYPNKLAIKLLGLGEAAMGLPKLYFIKISSLVVCALVLTAVGITNAAYEKKTVIHSGNDAALYHRLLTDADIRRANAKGFSAYEIIGEKIAQYLNTSDEKKIREHAEVFLQKQQKIREIRVFKGYQIWILLFSFYLPEIILFLRWILRGCIYKREIIKLEYIFELLARIDGIKTMDIIGQLEKASKIYSPYLNKFSKIFRFDKRKGFQYLRNKNIKSLSRLAEIIEIYSLSDREVAMQILEREVMERDEAMLVTAEETMDIIDLAAFLSIVPLVYELVMLMLRPMLDVVYKAFELI